MLGASIATAAYTKFYANTPKAFAAETLDLNGVSILITGCSSGFGRLGAEHYARLGAKVFATMRNLPRREAVELQALAKSDKLDITVLEIDVTKDDQVQTSVDAALKAAGGKIDVLINNAGLAIAGPIEAQDMTATQLIFDTNLFGVQRMIEAVMPSMRANGGGHIVNITSQLGRMIIPGFGQYSPTKFALEALSEQLAYEAAPHGIEVSIIQPGAYPTKIWTNQNPPTAALKTRLSDDVISAYPRYTAGMGKRQEGDYGTDPMDVPRAIASAIALPKGKRPLRIAVHPFDKPQEIINKVSEKVQIEYLGNSSIVKSVFD